MMRRLKIVTWALLALIPVAGSAAESRSLAGRPLLEALAQLQTDGLRIVYSSAVVTPAMVVEKEPESGHPRDILEQILAPHGLMAKDGPGGTILIVVAPPATDQIPVSGEVRGLVTVGGAPIWTPDMLIEIEGTLIKVAPAADGTFVIHDLPPGSHTVTVTSAGFVPQSIADIQVRPGGHQVLRFDLVPVSVFLNEVIVTPSHFRLLDNEPGSGQFLDREEVQQMPHAADDLYRAVKRLPGAAGGDFTAKINVRGGEQEVAVEDGVRGQDVFRGWLTWVLRTPRSSSNQPITTLRWR